MTARKEGGETRIWGITRRWILNGLGIILLVLVALILRLLLVVQGYMYNDIQQTTNGRSSELTNVFAGYDNRTASEFSGATCAYVESSPSRQMMGMTVLSTSGRTLVTSTGFPPNQDQAIPGVRTVQADKDGYGTWQGRLSSGEKVMAVTREIRSQAGSPLGSIRYIVSLEEVDRQTLAIVGGLLIIGFLVILLVVFFSSHFIKPIIDPTKLINAMAKRIVQGDFDVRIQNCQRGEIGELCETINKMVVEFGTVEKMRNDFISSVSHELRTPLTAIKGQAETPQGVDETECETYEKGMGVIIRESERLSGIMEELLDLSRMQNGRMTPMMDKIDTLAELGEAVYLFTDRAQAEGKFLVYEESPLLPPTLGDINRLRQVFVNIIDNALRYIKEGSTVIVTAEEANGEIRVVISDTGYGISAKDPPNVKKKPYKVNQTVRGSGIRLALAGEIMRLHDGRLELGSQEGVGTVVIITMPTLRQSVPEAKPAPATEERSSE